MGNRSCWLSYDCNDRSLCGVSSQHSTAQHLRFLSPSKWRIREISKLRSRAAYKWAEIGEGFIWTEAERFHIVHRIKTWIMCANIYRTLFMFTRSHYNSTLLLGNKQMLFRMHFNCMANIFLQIILSSSFRWLRFARHERQAAIGGGARCNSSIRHSYRHAVGESGLSYTSNLICYVHVRQILIRDR